MLRDISYKMLKAAERYWSSNYIQHSAHIQAGRDGLFNLIRSMPESLGSIHLLKASHHPRRIYLPTTYFLCPVGGARALP
jgi:hypothetical protein